MDARLPTALFALLLLCSMNFAITVATDGNITYDGSYTVVTFLQNGSFNVTGGTINLTVLVVAGGGGAATGGGGAGGLIYNSSYPVAGNINVVVGKGGAGATAGSGINGGNGENSAFDSLTATGGGAGGNNGKAGNNGGSGGGGGADGAVMHDGGTGVAGQGYKGGWNFRSGSNDPYPSGGGGGAGGEGTNGTTVTGPSGSGGAGLNYSISGINTNYSCGGGGGIFLQVNGFGLGGCGNGGDGTGNNVGGGNGINGTGSGGGGAGNGQLGGAGGSGIVIVRYLPGPNTTSIVAEVTPIADSLNKTVTIDYNVTTNGSEANTTVYLDGTELQSNLSSINQSYSITTNTTYGQHNVSVFSFYSANTSENSTASTTFTIYFNISNAQPLNNSELSGTSAIFQYNTTNLYPVQCRLFSNAFQLDNATIASAQAYQTIKPASSGANQWYVSCYAIDNPSYLVNSSQFNFTASAGNLSGYYVISLLPENVLAIPQAIFYDLNGNLNVFYYTSDNGSSTAQLRTLTSGSVSKYYSLPNNQTNNFISVMRLNNTTLILTFDSLNSTANFLQYDNATLSNAIEATSFNAQSNSYYDPYNYAYTKQFQTLSMAPSSYYLFIIQNGTSTNLVSMNATLNTSNIANLSTVATFTPPFTWQTIANNSNLTSWYYAAPKGGSPYTITIYSYNGTSTEVATPDPTTYPAANITAAKVFFESYGNNTYFMQANISNPLIYLLGTTKNTTLNGTITNPSQFYFVDKWTFVFFSTEGASTYAYSCYFETDANCTKISAMDYGATVPYARGQLTTSKRIANVLTGPQDVVTNGFISGANNSTLLYYNEYAYDLKMKCQDEINQTRDTMNVRIFSNTNAVTMNPSTYVYGYVLPMSLLGSGVKKVYSFCPTGTSRMYVFNQVQSLDTFSLVNVAPNAYYTFLLTDCFGQPSRNSLVSAQRFMSDRQDYATVEQSFSSIGGDAVLFLQPFANYKLIVNASDGYNLEIAFTPATTATIPVSLECAGRAINITPSYDQIYDDLSYRIMARNILDGKIVTGGSTNQSFNISFNTSSPQGRIYWSNFLVYRTIGDGTRTLIYNVTDNGIKGAYREFMVNSTTGAAYYEMAMNLNVLRLDVNNSGGSYNLSASGQRATLTTTSSVSLLAYDSAINDIRKNLGGAFGGWAWVLITTVLTMLLVGYLSRFTLDGAGLIGAMFFLGMALINPVSVAFGGNMLPMAAIGAIGLMVAMLLIVWRYL